jgi:hypothetical protein
MSYRAIDEVFAFLAEEAEGDGVPAVSKGSMLYPLITGNKALLPLLRKDAQLVADTAGVRVRLVRFTSREDIETLLPASGCKQ